MLHFAIHFKTYIYNVWHSGTLALSPEHQSARISETKNAGYTWMALTVWMNATICCRYILKG